MKTIHELAEQRFKCARAWEAAQMVNIAGLNPEERLKVEAHCALVGSAFRRADQEYQSAIAKLSTEELIALSRQPESSS